MYYYNTINIVDTVNGKNRQNFSICFDAMCHRKHTQNANYYRLFF